MATQQSPPTSLQIPSEGYTLDADLYLPQQDKSQGRLPQVIVLGHGLGATKSMGLDAFAQHFTTLGLAAICIDYRGFGNSTGALREYVNPYQHIQDINNALQYIRDGHVKEVDRSRISLWGISFSGGEVLKVASQPQNADLTAVVATVPFVGTFEAITRLPFTTLLRMVPLSIADKVRSWVVPSKPALRMQVAGKPGELAILSAPDCNDGYYGLAPQGKRSWTYGGGVPARMVVEILFYRPTWAVARIKAPTLVIAAKQDSGIPFWAIRRNTRAIPSLQFHSLDCGHFDVFAGRSHYQQTLELQTEFLKTTLGL